MRVKLLIATSDGDYAGHLSNTMSKSHADVIEVSACSTAERLSELLSAKRFDVALFEEAMIEGADLRFVHLPLLLQAGDDSLKGAAAEFKTVRKYQRISSIVAVILEYYAKASSGKYCSDSKKAHTTAVWSPAGGVGKTTVALAYSLRKMSDGKQVLYLNLETFSSSPTYFDDTGKSISAVFEMLEADEGNVEMLIRSIQRQDAGTGIAYMSRPENFDDINILSPEHLARLINACSRVADELVIDLSCVCDERTRQALELADRVLLVTDPSGAAQVKLSQFAAQHSAFARVRAKTTLVANKGAAAGEPIVDTLVCLPFVQTADASAVYRALSAGSFDG
jgi:MinD-like ATPase involved in chromosome partitioning or flagellar assembly